MRVQGLAIRRQPITERIHLTGRDHVDQITKLSSQCGRKEPDARCDAHENDSHGPQRSLGVMVLQGILAPLPAFVVTFANGLAFGAFAGWLISLAGHVAASSVCFGIARRLGRRRVQSLVSTKSLGSADRWLERWGPHAVLVTRLAPGISFDGISYAAGLTSISFKRFVVATTLGVIPETLLFAYLGHSAKEHAPLVMGISFAVALSGLLVAFFVGRSRATRSDSE